MSSLRLERVRELLKRELGEIIRREVPISEAGLITVNDVNVSSDLHSAAVYVGIMGSEEQSRAAEIQKQAESAFVAADCSSSARVRSAAKLIRSSCDPFSLTFSSLTSTD